MTRWALASLEADEKHPDNITCVKMNLDTAEARAAALLAVVKAPTLEERREAYEILNAIWPDWRKEVE